ncbi:hypothetical protein B0H17DRAFT_1129334 [Mycena rosella]|uniref:Uncharacterized protein n=1 Tax=Mycena rosella TaxID=1033263 RepID=A0AAD7DUH5_MYCRO|nr:hypothetical protein B0H17DRAFT_1129334 [Mycena rosella]
MSKPKSRHKEPTDSYIPGPRVDKRSTYWTNFSHPEIRVRRQLEMAEKRARMVEQRAAKVAEKKLKRRRWDPPKPLLAEPAESTPPPIARDAADGSQASFHLHQDQHLRTSSPSARGISQPPPPDEDMSQFSFHFPQYDFQDPRALSRHGDSHPSERHSLTSDERMAIEALAILAAGVAVNALDGPEQEGVDSILAKADQLSELEQHEGLPNSSGSEPNFWGMIEAAAAQIDFHHLPAGITPLAQGQRAWAAGALVLTRSQAAQIYVALLNTGQELLQPTGEQQLQWRWRNKLGGQYLTYFQERTIDTWRIRVQHDLTAQEAARALHASCKDIQPFKILPLPSMGPTSLATNGHEPRQRMGTTCPAARNLSIDDASEARRPKTASQSQAHQLGGTCVPGRENYPESPLSSLSDEDSEMPLANLELEAAYKRYSTAVSKLQAWDEATRSTRRNRSWETTVTALRKAVEKARKGVEAAGDSPSEQPAPLAPTEQGTSHLSPAAPPDSPSEEPRPSPPPSRARCNYRPPHLQTLRARSPRHSSPPSRAHRVYRPRHLQRYMLAFRAYDEDPADSRPPPLADSPAAALAPTEQQGASQLSPASPPDSPSEKPAPLTPAEQGTSHLLPAASPQDSPPVALAPPSSKPVPSLSPDEAQDARRQWNARQPERDARACIDAEFFRWGHAVLIGRLRGQNITADAYRSGYQPEFSTFLRSPDSDGAPACDWVRVPAPLLGEHFIEHMLDDQWHESQSVGGSGGSGDVWGGGGRGEWQGHLAGGMQPWGTGRFRRTLPKPLLHKNGVRILTGTGAQRIWWPSFHRTLSQPLLHKHGHPEDLVDEQAKGSEGKGKRRQRGEGKGRRQGGEGAEGKGGEGKGKGKGEGEGEGEGRKDHQGKGEESEGELEGALKQWMRRKRKREREKEKTVPLLKEDSLGGREVKSGTSSKGRPELAEAEKSVEEALRDELISGWPGPILHAAYIRDVQELCPNAGALTWKIFLRIHRTAGANKNYVYVYFKGVCSAVNYIICSSEEVALDYFAWKGMPTITREVGGDPKRTSAGGVLRQTLEDVKTVTQGLDPRAWAFFCETLKVRGITIETIFSNGATEAQHKLALLQAQMDVMIPEMTMLSLATKKIPEGESLALIHLNAADLKKWAAVKQAEFEAEKGRTAESDRVHGGQFCLRKVEGVMGSNHKSPEGILDMATATESKNAARCDHVKLGLDNDGRESSNMFKFYAQAWPAHRPDIARVSNWLPQARGLHADLRAKVTVLETP